MPEDTKTGEIWEKKTQRHRNKDFPYREGR